MFISGEDDTTMLDRIIFRAARNYCSDKIFAILLFKRIFNRKIDLVNPQTFNEKIQWLKLYDRNPFYTVLADKYAVRDYVIQRVGVKYLNRLIGVYCDAEEISIDSLPNEFVLKGTHGSGFNIICQDKANLNWNACKKQMSKWLRFDYFKLGREWVYKNIKPRLVCEEFLRDKSGGVPKDFKFFCFNGVPKLIQIDIDRFENHTRAFYSHKWERMPFELMYKTYGGDIDKPDCLEEMLSVASSLSSGIPFCRVDLYSLPRIVFGEITFYPENGTGKFSPEEVDAQLGALIELP